LYTAIIFQTEKSAGITIHQAYTDFFLHDGKQFSWGRSWGLGEVEQVRLLISEYEKESVSAQEHQHFNSVSYCKMYNPVTPD